MSELDEQLNFQSRPAKKCPVCQQSSYSFGGIHPQCAVKKADEPKKQALSEERKLLRAKKKSMNELDRRNQDTRR
jgi:hypothetical protein